MDVLHPRWGQFHFEYPGADPETRFKSLEEIISDLVHLSLKRKLRSSVEAQALRLHRYETDNGLFDHDHDTDPMSMALLRQHPAESLSIGSRFRERARMFANSQVYKHFGVSWDAFIKMTPKQCDTLLEIAEDLAAAEHRAMQGVRDSLDAKKD